MRVLAINIGNSTVSGGVFFDGRLVRRIQAPLEQVATRAGFCRVFSRALSGKFNSAALASVVPPVTEAIAAAVQTLTGCKPRILTGPTQAILRIRYVNPSAMGSDRVAAAIGAHHLYPLQAALVVDCGTATTVTALSRDGVVLGGAILPGLGLWSEMLAAKTAQLPKVPPKIVRRVIGRSPSEGIAAGIHVGHVGAIRELVARMKREAFGRGKSLVIATGGAAAHFEAESLFDVIEPDLVLRGLCTFAQS
jgi:type III pantothenate kinase